MRDERKNEPQTAVMEERGGKRQFIVLLICLVAAVAIAVGCLGGGIGYVAGKHKAEKNAQPQTVVIHSQEGETVAGLSSGSTHTVADVVEAVADTVAEINCKVITYVNTPWGQLKQEGASAGSGVIMAENGYIITNHHVIENATEIKVTLHNGTDYEECAATLINSDAENDIAVIKVEKTDLPYATFGDSSALKVGQPVVVIGNPLGTLGGTVTDGIVSALDRAITIDGTTMTLLQTNAAINSGNSGGGMFDLDGRLIGVVNAKSSGTGIEGLGFAIPANTAKQVYERLLTA